MAPRCHLRNHSSRQIMFELCSRRHSNESCILHQSHRSVITGCFEGEDIHGHIIRILSILSDFIDCIKYITNIMHMTIDPTYNDISRKYLQTLPLEIDDTSIL